MIGGAQTRQEDRDALRKHPTRGDDEGE